VILSIFQLLHFALQWESMTS